MPLDSPSEVDQNIQKQTEELSKKIEELSGDIDSQTLEINQLLSRHETHLDSIRLNLIDTRKLLEMIRSENKNFNLMKIGFLIALLFLVFK